VTGATREVATPGVGGTRPARGAIEFGRALLAALVLVLIPAASRAGTEEFSTFDVEQQEEDDEALIDRYLTRQPRRWRNDWEHSLNAFRTGQGCLTSGQWIIETDLKLNTAMGDRARFAIEYDQSESDESRHTFLDLWFKFPIRVGVASAMFRPSFDKSTQDFGVAWETGADTTEVQARTQFIIEDTFNNLWAFRQSRVGDTSEPYERRPYEPGVFFTLRKPAARVEIEGRYLTPSQKRVPDPAEVDPDRLVTLWGTLARGQVELRGGGFEWEAAGYNKQADGTDQVEGSPFGDNGKYRRKWSAETALRRWVTPKWSLEGRYLYQERHQIQDPPLGAVPGVFDAIDRMIGVEAEWLAHPRIEMRFGGLYDRISIAQSGVIYQETYGTRNESRLFVGLSARIGRILVSGVEGVELDPEPYDVWLVHDKGFLHLQASF
jgi:hypothetical protein